jgi:hypothetical protein
LTDCDKLATIVNLSGLKNETKAREAAYNLGQRGAKALTFDGSKKINRASGQLMRQLRQEHDSAIGVQDLLSDYPPFAEPGRFQKVEGSRIFAN